MKIFIDSIMLNSYKLFHSLCFYQLRRVATLLLCYEVFPHLLIEFSALVDIGGVIFVFWIRNASRAFHAGVRWGVRPFGDGVAAASLMAEPTLEIAFRRRFSETPICT